MVSIRKILILYKKSSYKHFFLTRKALLRQIEQDEKLAERFRKTHDRHYQTLRDLENFLRQKGLRYSRMLRGRKKNFSGYDLIITVGGDGTFLEGASKTRDQLILGINSDPQWSVGRFCAATNETFPRILENIFKNRFQVKPLNRLKLRFKRRSTAVHALNDILICHKNPAEMSRYYLCLKGRKEEQRSSGIWVATAAGSTGAIYSAGGRVLPLASKQLQYVVRELYRGHGRKARLKSGVFSASRTFKVVSIMKDGVIYVDGSHIKIPFSFGEELIVANSEYPLQVVTG